MIPIDLGIRDRSRVLVNKSIKIPMVFKPITEADKLFIETLKEKEMKQDVRPMAGA